MRERAIRFGTGTTLIGVLAEPSQGHPPARLGVIFLNSGILHHVGACRLHVRLGRRLAEAGIPSLRFDFSGIGDSEPRRDALAVEQSAVLEVQEAMDHLQRTRGVEEFALVGLCSGADMGFRVSQRDPRVVALAQLDAYAYRTPGYWVHHYAPRLFSARRWRSLLRRKLLGRAPERPNGGQPPGEDYVRPEYRRRFPPKAEVEAGLRALLDRGVELIFLFSGGQADHYNHRGQHAAAFRSLGFRGRVPVEYYPGADHLFSALEHQRRVDAVLGDWIARVARARAGAQAAPAAEPAPPAALALLS